MPTKNEVIVLENFSPGDLTTVDAARKTRDHLLDCAVKIQGVTDKASAELALSTLRDLKLFQEAIEASRVKVKAPVLERAKEIDALAKELTSALAAQYTRICGPLSLYNAQQKRLAEEAQRKAWEEEQRIKREAEEKARAEQEAFEKARQELEVKAAKAATPQEAEQILSEEEELAIRAEVAAEQHQETAAQAIVDVRVAASVATPQNITGVASRMEPEYEITDIVALYEAQPVLVKLEPNKAAIKSALRQLREGQHLPGVRHWFVPKVSLR